MAARAADATVQHLIEKGKTQNDDFTHQKAAHRFQAVRHRTAP
jgi:hypothetical protein